MTMSNNWYALHVKPHKERAVYNLLISQEGARDIHTPGNGDRTVVFFPAVRVKPVNPRSAKVRPYFPGYLFVHANLASVGVNAFSWIPGTRGLVSFGDEPAKVPDQLIDELRSRMVRIEEAGGMVFDSLQKGDRVRIISGPLAGFEAIFDMRIPGQQRVQVLLAFLSSHPQRMKLDAGAIAKIDKPKGDEG
jgi:transcriptional antiterminator RfaH